MSYENLLFDLRDGVAHLTLNREKAANALDLDTCRELMLAAIRCDEDPEVRAVLVSGAGKMFCAGGDLRSFAGAGDGLPALLKEMTTYLHAAISSFARMDAPVIAAVQGAAAGAGFSLACATDLAIAAENAKFTMAYTAAGLTPDGSSTYYLPRLLGTRRTLELMLTNRRLSAQEALDWGLVNQVVPAEKLSEEATALATRLAQGPKGSFGALKKLVLESGSQSLETQMELESRGIAAASVTAEGSEGIAAFLEKRSPKFA